MYYSICFLISRSWKWRWGLCFYNGPKGGGGGVVMKRREGDNGNKDKSCEERVNPYFVATLDDILSCVAGYPHQI